MTELNDETLYGELTSRFSNLNDRQQKEILKTLIKTLPVERLSDVKEIHNTVTKYRKELCKEHKEKYPDLEPKNPTKYFALSISKIKTELKPQNDAAHVVLIDENFRIVLDYYVRHKIESIITTLPNLTGIHFSERKLYFAVKGKSKQFICDEIKRVVGSGTIIGFDLKLQADSLHYKDGMIDICTIDLQRFFVKTSPSSAGDPKPIGARHLFHYYFKYDICKGPSSAAIVAWYTMKLFKDVYLKRIKLPPETRNFLHIPRLPKPIRVKVQSYEPTRLPVQCNVNPHPSTINTAPLNVERPFEIGMFQADLNSQTLPENKFQINEGMNPFPDLKTSLYSTQTNTKADTVKILRKPKPKKNSKNQVRVVPGYSGLPFEFVTRK